jgi:hypothetical protein
MWCHGVSIIYFWQLIVESEDYSCLLQLQLCEQSFLSNLEHYINHFLSKHSDAKRIAYVSLSISIYSVCGKWLQCHLEF